MRKSIFLNDVTCIDHAYLDENNLVKGRSFLLSVIVTGEVPDSNLEQVVIDFSKCKKLIKECVDSNEDGFDHKCWVNDSVELVESNGYYNLDTPETKFSVPMNAIKIISEDYNLDIQNQIESFLQSKFPDIGITVSISLIDAISDDSVYYFQYVHGLKNSSSWGCQNLLHGHTSYINFWIVGDDRSNMYDKIYNDYELDDFMFIYSDNIISQTEDELQIGYETERGKFELIINTKLYSDLDIKVRIIDKETTIENLLEYILKDINIPVDTFMVSEGLQKGAIEFNWGK